MIQKNNDGLWTAYCDHCGVDYYENGFKIDGITHYGWQQKEGVEHDVPENWNKVYNRNKEDFYFCDDCLTLDDNDNYLLRAERKNLFEVPAQVVYRFDAEEFLNSKDIYNLPWISDRNDNYWYEIAEVMAEFANKVLNSTADKKSRS